MVILPPNQYHGGDDVCDGCKRRPGIIKLGDLALCSQCTIGRQNYNKGLWRSQVAQRAFNPLVVGSNPARPSLSQQVEIVKWSKTKGLRPFPKGTQVRILLSTLQWTHTQLG